MHAELPDILDTNGQIRLLPSKTYEQLSWENFRIWCHFHARYGIVTQELVSWIKNYIGHRKAIEIGSGHGDLAHHLDIPGTDNWCQTLPDVMLFYALAGQPVIEYPEWVEKIDAIDAIEKYKPEIVIGSWVTHWIDPTLPIPSGGGNMYGVKEDQIVDRGITYIMIGNLKIHQNKPILQRPHKELAFPFLWSRAKERDLDRIFIWND